MRKVPAEIENPVDNFGIEIGSYLSPYFKRLNFTPNTLTTISAVSGLSSIYFYTKRSYIISGFSYFLFHLFDSFDGFYARKYKMVTQFGDYYDHYKDIVVVSWIVLKIIRKYRLVKSWQKFLPIMMGIFGIFCGIHIGCQEEYFNKDEEKDGGDFLAVFRRLFKGKTKEELYKIMRCTRYVGHGTFTLSIISIILYSKVIDQKLNRALI